jgi:hypothetical protein
MFYFAAISVERSVLAVAVGGVVLYLMFNAFTAGYGRSKGYPFFPLFVSSLFMGFPLVLLVVTIAAGSRARRDRLSTTP